MMDDNSFYYFILSVIVFLVGYLIKLYLRWARINNLNQILGINIYWVKVYANILLLFGMISTGMYGLVLFLDYIEKWLF